MRCSRLNTLSINGDGGCIMHGKSWLAIAVVALGATAVHAATGTCTEELKSCRDRCKNEHKFTGSQLRNCEEQACPAAWGICMHSGYWTVTRSGKKIGPLQKK